MKKSLLYGLAILLAGVYTACNEEENEISIPEDASFLTVHATKAEPENRIFDSSDQRFKAFFNLESTKNSLSSLTLKQIFVDTENETEDTVDVATFDLTQSTTEETGAINHIFTKESGSKITYELDYPFTEDDSREFIDKDEFRYLLVLTDDKGQEKEGDIMFTYKTKLAPEMDYEFTKYEDEAVDGIEETIQLRWKRDDTTEKTGIITKGSNADKMVILSEKDWEDIQTVPDLKDAIDNKSNVNDYKGIPTDEDKDDYTDVIGVREITTESDTVVYMIKILSSTVGAELVDTELVETTTVSVKYRK